jgi:tRNA U34 2-thiouridine synthase MnmA/TrmU
MKIRHGPTIVNGMISSDDGENGKIVLDKKDGGLAPGQFVAFYRDDECLGSAVISEKHWLKFLDRNQSSVVQGI